MAYTLKLAGRFDTDALWAHILQDGEEVGSFTHSGGGLTKDPLVKMDLKGHPKDGEVIGKAEAEEMFGKPEEGDWAIRSEETAAVVANLAAGDMTSAEEAFKAVMDQKIGAAMRNQEGKVARAMFGQSEES